MKNLLNPVVFLLGLLAVCWVGIGYLGSNPLGAAIALVIGACYIAGALELYRYRQATATLKQAVAEVAPAQSDLGTWLGQLHPSLRNAVRLRIEGERIALPAPALTPYLVGLLVLLGMLGTLLGMMATLRGTGFALESATDLQAIRGSLAAPVKGLAFAFGTSIAGVASSAMLGLLSALCRRERLEAVQGLDVQIATTLHAYSPAHQRAEAFKLLQQQTALMPTLIERLQAMMTALETRSASAETQLAARHEDFHARTETVYTRLAASVEQSLKSGVAESARAVGATLQPVVEATMAGVVRDTTALHDTITQAVQHQLESLATGFDTVATRTAQTWDTALAAQQRTNDALTQDLRSTLEGFAATYDQRSAGLVDALATRLDANADASARTWNDALARQETAHAQLASHHQQALQAAAATFESHATSLVGTLQQSHAELQGALESRDQQRLALWGERFASMTEALNSHWAQTGEQVASRQQDICDTLARTANDIATHAQTQASDTIAQIARLVQAATDAQAAVEARDTQRLGAWSEHLGTMTTALNARWEQTGEHLASRQQEICDTLARTANDIAAHTQQHASQTIAEISRLVQSAADTQASVETRDTQRLDAWSQRLTAMTDALHTQWERTGEHVAIRQQEICDTLARTAGEISAQAQRHASETIAEISRLVQVASEAPKAAADVVAELRQKLSDSMVRDTAMLEERSRLLATLETLLDAVNHASTEQRTAVDALVSTSADLLDRVGTRFTDHIQAQTGKLETVAAQVTGSAVEVAGLGDAFGAAVQQFGSSNEALMERLQHIAGALDTTLSRSDEQLAYYVAQAREVVDLSVLSQKQIIEELHQLAGRQATTGSAAA